MAFNFGTNSYAATGCMSFTLVIWVVFSFIASLAGGSYVKSTLDCLTPAALAQAATALLYSITTSCSQHRNKTTTTKLSAPPSERAHDVARRAWVLALGVLHLLSSILTLASFGLSSVADTYIIRTLEPLCSALLLYLIHGHRRTPAEVVLLAAVAVGTASVLLTGPQPDRGLALTGFTQQHEAVQLPGRAIPVALALVATLAVSCRSVASKTVTALTGTPEYDMWLQASIPGLGAAVLLQVALWALFGVQLLQSPEGGWSNTLSLTLALSLGLQCAYNAASFKVLQSCSPVTHGMLNVLKRVCIIVACAALLGRPLTFSQLLGIALANVAAAAYAARQLPGASAAVVVSGCYRGSSTCSSGLAGDSCTAAAAADTHGGCEHDYSHAQRGLNKKGARCSWFGYAPARGSYSTTSTNSSGSASLSSAKAQGRLVGVVGATILVSAVFLAYVIAALHAPAVRIQHHQQHHLQQHMLEQWLQQDTHPSAPAHQPHRAAAQWSSGAAHASGVPSDSSTEVSASAAVVVPDAVRKFMLRDAGRVQCLAALHEVSKASLAPFLHNRSQGGIALYDVALHKNLGDAVLWAAAARLVPTFHQSIKYVCAQSQYPGGGRSAQAARKVFPRCNVQHMLKAIGPGGVVLLAPGGNWGDLWWFVHSQRLKYLLNMAAVVKGGATPFQVVQLPQSISFNSTTNIQADQKVINSMPPGMLTLFARQQTSLDYAKQHYPTTAVLPGPDLAFSLGPLMGPPAKYDILFLMRKDKEAAGSEKPLASMKAPPAAAAGTTGLQSVVSGRQQKWVRQLLGRVHEHTGASSSASADSSEAADAAAVVAALEQLHDQGVSYVVREWDFGAQENVTREVSRIAMTQVAESRLQDAVDVISLGKIVVTNRLHAAIMANLVGRPLIWIDTEQKKLSGVRSLAFAYHKSCTERNMHSVQASSFAEAVQIAQEWLQSPHFTWSTQHMDLGLSNL